MEALVPFAAIAGAENSLRAEPQHKRGANAHHEITRAPDAGTGKRVCGGLGAIGDVKVLADSNHQPGHGWGKQAPSVVEPSTPPQGAERCSHYADDWGDVPTLEQAFCHLPPADQDYLRCCLDRELLCCEVDPDYLRGVQFDVDGRKRLVLVDWMVEVVDEFALTQETLFLAVRLLDRYLSRRCVVRAQLQLVGVTCLWLASKYEEVSPPVLADFVEITDNSYRTEELLAMEGELLRALGYQLGGPNALTFLHHFLAQYHCAQQREQQQQQQQHAALVVGGGPGAPAQHALPPSAPGARRVSEMSEYVLELALLMPEALRFRPSLLAASALQLSAVLLGQGDAGRLCRAVSGGADDEAAACLQQLAHMLEWAGRASKPSAVTDKYSQRGRGCVAQLAGQQPGCGAAAAAGASATAAPGSLLRHSGGAFVQLL